MQIVWWLGIFTDRIIDKVIDKIITSIMSLVIFNLWPDNQLSSSLFFFSPNMHECSSTCLCIPQKIFPHRQLNPVKPTFLLQHWHRIFLVELEAAVLLTWLLTTQLHRYISESCENMIANVTIIDGVTDGIRSWVYFKKLEKNYYKYHRYC